MRLHAVGMQNGVHTFFTGHMLHTSKHIQHALPLGARIKSFQYTLILTFCTSMVRIWTRMTLREFNLLQLAMHRLAAIMCNQKV